MTYTVLIVDDSKLARMSVAKALAALQPDWVRFEAKDADEALVVANKSQVDLALVDFNMPGRDGLELAAELRRSHPHTLVAVVSANYQAEIVDRVQNLGAKFLSKPLTEKALAEFIATTIPQPGSVR